MAGRLGSRFPPEGVEWWIQHMGRTAVSTQVGFFPKIADSDITDALPKIRCPTLVITTEGSGLASVEETRAWQRMIPRSELLVLPGDSYHVAASDADRCAQETLEHLSPALPSQPLELNHWSLVFRLQLALLIRRP